MGKAGYVGNQPVRESQAESYPGAWTGQEQYQEIRNNNWPKPIYEVERSIRLNSEDATFFSRTPASASNRKTWTWSGWVKKVKNESILPLLNARQSSSDFLNIWFDSGDGLFVRSRVGGSDSFYAYTAAVFRDPSAWYHVLIAVDTTQASSSNGVKVYVNGTQQTLTIPTYNQNADTYVNSTFEHRIGYLINQNSSTYYLDSYLADLHLIDGQALTPSAFATTDPDTNQWVPKKYANSYGYGPNGFWLKFADNSAATAATLGKDSSPSGNNWTPNNFSINTGEAVPVATATGGIPIHNTTDTFGATIGYGVRTDVNASTLVLAAPLTTAGSNGLSDDESPAGRVSSTKTLTANGSIASSTSIAKYYGGAASFAAGGYYQLSSSDFTFGTGDFTIEAWVYNPSTTSGSLFATNTNSLATTTFNARFYGNTQTINVYTSGGSDYITVTQVPVNQWVHIAMCRSGGSTMRVFIDGVLRATSFGWAASLTDSDQFFINTGRDGSGARYYQDVRVYKGLAKYSADFIVPDSAPKPLISAGNDSLVDTPTSYGTDTGAGGEVRGNYSTWGAPYAAAAGLSNGNLDFLAPTTMNAFGSISVTSGKWYWEILNSGTGLSYVGIMDSTITSATDTSWSTQSRAYVSGGSKYNGSSSSYGSSWAAGDVIGFALDLDSNSLTFYKNGVSQGVAFSTGLIGKEWKPFVYGSSGSGCSANFGQRPFAYTAPSGFKALCDTNLPAPVVAKSSDYFQTTLWTGNGGSQSISSLSFSPDFVWIKARSAGSTDHCLFDTIRGATKGLHSNQTIAEWTDTATLTAFNSNGFTLAGHPYTNGNGTTYAGWAFDAGATTTTNTAGSITSSCRTNQSSGFSIATFTAPSSGSATIGHGLGVEPHMIIIKSRDQAYNWCVYHKALTSNAYFLNLNTTAAQSNASNIWNNTTPTSTVFSLGSGYAGAGATVAYLFSPVAGYSSFGSYTGNGSADGPFVYTGFRPRWVMIKRSDAVGSWGVLDTARNTFNVSDKLLWANLSDAEGTYTILDILSNGFKLRESTNGYNTSTGTYIYAAFAENPFQYARAR